MLTPFPQNWCTSNLPYSLALTNAVNTGGSFTTPSNATQNSKVWASAGFRGFGPMMTFPGSGLDGTPSLSRRFGPVGTFRVGGMGSGCGCGCGGGCGCGSHGMSGLTFDGTGLFGTGLFCWPPFGGDGSCSWGIGELVVGLIGAYAIYSMFYQTKQTKVRLEGAAQRRRRSRATKYRARAKALEEKGFGGIFA